MIRTTSKIAVQGCDTKQFIVILFLILFTGAISSSQDPVIITRLEKEIVFDGMPDEDEWNTIVPLPVTTFQPVTGREPSEKTEILLGYTDDYLWIAGRLYDSEPSLIRHNSKKRDDFGEENDYFGVMIDCLNDNENAFFFCTSPSGNRLDMNIFNDARNTVPYNLSWNTFWDVKTAITEQGWFAEMRIPLSSLRFKEINGKATMGLIINRWIPRKNELIVFPGLDSKYGTWVRLRPSMAHDIEIKGVKPGKPVYITPYILGGTRMTHEPDEDGESFKRSEKITKEAGLDLKYGITSYLTLDLTVNTDFAQVEDDDQQVNITRFSLFYPEKRVFFQERSDLFNFSYGYNGLNGNIFYSRRIGLHENDPVRILGGARLTGKIGKFDVGLINMQTAKYSAELPSENFNVFRVKRVFLNPYSYAGGIFTSRIRPDGNHDITYGFDTFINTAGDDYVELKVSQTLSTGKNYKHLMDNTYLRYNMESSNNNRGWSYRASFDWLGKDYNPAMGYLQRGNVFIPNGNVRYAWMPGENSFFFYHKFNYKSAAYFNTDGSFETLITGPGYEFETKNKIFGGVDPEFRREIIRDTFYIDSKTYIPAGAYSFLIVKGFINSPASVKFLVNSEFEIGQYYDGTLISVKAKPLWSVSGSVRLEGQYQYNLLSIPARDQRYLSHVAGLKMTYMFSTKLSAGAFVQYNSTADAFLTNIRLRYNPREGNDFYIVFNEGRNTILWRESLMLPRVDNLTLQVKYSHTFRL
jgi:hypothetical protein